MPLTIGSRLGSYEIIAPIGAGGMGEVYRARDRKLDRDVAIKVLPESLAGDPERAARFDREAKTLASLNHPNIAHIHGVEDSNGTRALVMELVEGPTLADLLASGSGLQASGGLPIAEVLTIARQIAEALEAAHEQGIIHRDLKPANIKVRPDGTVKILDFGLAKAMDPAASSSIVVTQSPTISLAATQAGVILGTAAYMAPEQARGKPVERRVDIWAFGVVLYEMLTGRRPFDGDDLSMTLASVMMKDPDWSALPADTPNSLRRLLRRCLEREPKRRLRDIGEARVAIEDLLSGAIDETALAPAAASIAPIPKRSRYAIGAAVAGIVALIAATGVAGWFAHTVPQPEAIALTLEPFLTNRADAFAISPDGRQIAFSGSDKDGRSKVWVRSLASTEARALQGSEPGNMPFWSPDSRSIAYFTATELKRVDLVGGAVQTICKTVVGNVAGGTWSSRNVILFARGGLGAGGMFKVSAGGGEPEKIALKAAGEANDVEPTFLPDGRHFLYLRVMASSENSELVWRDLDSSDEHVVRRLYSKAFYSPPGYLIFRLGGPVFVQRFDPSKGTASGDPVQLLGNTFQNSTQTALAVSPAGVIAHRGGQFAAVAQLTWLDRQGKPLTKVGQPGDYRNPALEPATERVVANTADAASDLWLFDRRGTTSRLTFDTGISSDGVFSPDGKWLAFYSSREPPGIYRRGSNGAGADELVAATGAGSYPRDWSSDGRFLLYGTGPAIYLWVLPLEGDRKPYRYPPTQAASTSVSLGHFSPDVKYIAYMSNETGRPEIFVQDFPAATTKVQVSLNGGGEPRWRGDGRELYFIASDGQLMAVDVGGKPELTVGVPKALFQTRLLNLIDASRRYGVSTDGQRFLMNVPIGEQVMPPITVVTHWQSLLKQ